MSLDVIVDLLVCPYGDVGTQDPLTLAADGRSMACPAGHSFDVARQGYVNLLGGGGGDTADMVAARERFLSAGHYRPIADAVVESVTDVQRERSAPLAIADIGAGGGYYLAYALERLGRTTRGIAADISVPASRRAARAHPQVGAIVADTWQTLPIRDHSLDTVLCVFAPRQMAEFHRVLAPGGALIVVTPLAEHLAEVRTPLGLLGIEEGKQSRLSASAAGLFAVAGRQEVRFTLAADRSSLVDLVAMGPNAFHATLEQITEQVADLALPSTGVSAAVSVATFVRS